MSYTYWKSANSLDGNLFLINLTITVTLLNCERFLYRLWSQQILYIYIYATSTMRLHIYICIKNVILFDLPLIRHHRGHLSLLFHVLHKSAYMSRFEFLLFIINFFLFLEFNWKHVKHDTVKLCFYFKCIYWNCESQCEVEVYCGRIENFFVDKFVTKKLEWRFF